MLSRKRQERKMMMKTAKTLGFAGSVPEWSTTWSLRSAEKLGNLFSVEIRKICARGRKGSVDLKNGEPSQKTKGLDFGIIVAEEVEGKDGR